MSRTEVNGKPVQRERGFVRGNPSLTSLWESVKHLKGDQVLIKADYVWSEMHVESIRFSAVVKLTVVDNRKSIPDPKLQPNPDPAIRDPPVPNPDKDEDKDEEPPPVPRRNVDPPPLRRRDDDPNKILEYAKKVLKYLEDTNTEPELATRLRR